MRLHSLNQQPAQHPGLPAVGHSIADPATVQNPAARLSTRKPGLAPWRLEQIRSYAGSANAAISGAADAHSACGLDAGDK